MIKLSRVSKTDTLVRIDFGPECISVSGFNGIESMYGVGDQASKQKLI